MRVEPWRPPPTEARVCPRDVLVTALVPPGGIGLVSIGHVTIFPITNPVRASAASDRSAEGTVTARS